VVSVVEAAEAVVSVVEMAEAVDLVETVTLVVLAVDTTEIATLAAVVVDITDINHFSPRYLMPHNRGAFLFYVLNYKQKFLLSIGKLKLI